MDIEAHVCIDKRTPEQLRLEIPGVMTRRDECSAPSSMDHRKLWQNGKLLRIYFYGAAPQEQIQVLTWAEEWSQTANISFAISLEPDAEIRVSQHEGQGSWSYLGTDCERIHPSQPTMNLGCLERNTVLHQFGHALGLPHERRALDEELKLNEDAIYASFRSGYESWNRSQVYSYFIRAVRQDSLRAAEYDMDSIMAPVFDDTWVSAQNPFVQSHKGLSKADKAFVASIALYPKAPRYSPKEREGGQANPDASAS